MFRRLERHVTLLFAVALVTITSGIVLASYRAKQHAAAQAWVAHTHDVLASLDASLSALNEAESDERGFVLGNDEAFAPAFERAAMVATQNLSAARAMVSDNVAQLRRTEQLLTSLQGRLGDMRGIMRDSRASQRTATSSAAVAAADETEISRLRDSLQAVERDERKLLEARQQALDAADRQATWAVFGLGAISLAVLALAFITVHVARRRQRVAEQGVTKVNDELRLRVDELLWRGREAAGLQRLSEALQLCLTPSEAHEAVALAVPALLGEQSGGLLAVTRASRNLVERVSSWGTLAGDAAFDSLPPEDCCALRSGKTYLVREGEPRLRCAHRRSDIAGDYVCLPLAAHGETLGILHVAFPPSTEVAGETESGKCGDDRMALLQRASEQIAVALANLALRDRLKQQSIRDALTGAFNRRYLEESLDREIVRARRHGHRLALVMLDVDHFKRVNDRHGHEVGDDVLRTIAEVIQHSVREEDIVCRYGGEEFAILLPEIEPDVARARAQAIVDAARAQHVAVHGQPIGPVTVSAGLALHAANAESGAELLRRADVALYSAKRAGRDRVVEDAAVNSAA